VACFLNDAIGCVWVTHSRLPHQTMTKRFHVAGKSLLKSRYHSKKMTKKWHGEWKRFGSKRDGLICRWFVVCLRRFLLRSTCFFSLIQCYCFVLIVGKVFGGLILLFCKHSLRGLGNDKCRVLTKDIEPARPEPDEMLIQQVSTTPTRFTVYCYF
jgi:hypothetical protein